MATRTSARVSTSRRVFACCVAKASEVSEHDDPHATPALPLPAELDALQRPLRLHRRQRRSRRADRPAVDGLGEPVVEVAVRASDLCWP
jgi:hypothetical protein